LAYLILHPERAFSRTRLAGLFWPERAEELARRALSNTLWQLRGCLAGAAARLTTDGESVVFQPDVDDWLDVREFEQLLDQHPNAPAAQGLSALQAAIQLYEGDLLADLYDDWCLLERERLRERYLGALEELLTLQKQSGAYDRALITAHRLVAADPLREWAQQELMRLYYLLERPRAALAQFDKLRTLLATELHTAPMPSTVALYHEIAAALEEPAAPYLPIEVSLPLLGDLHRLPFVGRGAERRELLHALKGALQGHGGLVILRGAAGVGKSRLVGELIADAEWRGLQVGLAKVTPLGAVPPYQLLREALSSLLTPLRICQLAELVEARWLSALAPLFPVIREHLPDLPPLPPLDLQAEWQRLWEALAQSLRALAAITPLLLVLEDVHWADNASLAALPQLAAHVGDSPLLLVLTSRIVEAHERPLVLETLEAAGQNAPLTRITLPPFTSGEIDTLLHRALAVRAEDVTAGAFAEQLAVTTGGNALHLLERLKLLFEQGALVRETNEGWRFPDKKISVETPTSIKDLVKERVARLPATTREVLELAVVLGEDADFSVFAAARIVSPTELPQHLERLAQRGFLRQTEAGYRFEHDLVRSGVYDGFPQPQQRALHRRAGEALESVCPGRIEALAYHWTRAESWEQAVDYHQQAGDRARAVYAHTQALDHYAQASAAFAHLPGPPDRARLFTLGLAREAIYNLLGDRAAQAEELDALAALVEDWPSAEQQAEVALRRARYSEETGDYVAAISAAQAALSLANNAGAIEAKGKAHMEWGRALWRQGAYDDARTQFEQALTQGPNMRQLKADALNNLGNVCLYQGDYAQAQAFYEQTLPLHRELGNRQGEGNALYNLGYAVHDLGDLVSACTYYRQALDIYRDIGFRRGEGSALMIYGIALQDRGDYIAAWDHYQQALHILRDIGDRQGKALSLANIGTILMLLGAYDMVQPYFEQTLSIHREVGDRRGEAVTLNSLSLLHCFLEDYWAAEEYARKALPILHELGARHYQAQALTNLGHALTGLGQEDAAADAYRQAVDLRQELEEGHLAMEPLAGLVRGSLTQGDLPQALAHTEQILGHLQNEILTGTDEPIRIYLTCYRVLHASGDPRAAGILEAAHALLQERAAGIDDEEMRDSFMKNVVAHQELLDAYREWQILQQGHQRTVRLPRAGAPTGRPLTEDEFVEVTWTLTAPEDDEIQGKAKRRRHRILRLLREAGEQGAEPTVEDLAGALEVSARTIKRDLAALRAAGHTVTTRGSRKPT
jgi:DNA-binding SARP family transcriptional activator/Tfp pilus assembly protein PilF/DNA-binding transcriptional ArsR family regulator